MDSPVTEGANQATKWMVPHGNVVFFRATRQ